MPTPSTASLLSWEEKERERNQTGGEGTRKEKSQHETKNSKTPKVIL